MDTVLMLQFVARTQYLRMPQKPTFYVFKRNLSLSRNMRIRIFDRDGEIWHIGTRGIDHEYGTDPKPDIEIPANLDKKEYKYNLDILLKYPQKFKHDGNALGGDKEPSLESVSRITFDLLPRGIEGVLILDNVRFE